MLDKSQLIDFNMYSLDSGTTCMSSHSIVHMCMRVCVRERKRERKRSGEREITERIDRIDKEIGNIPKQNKFQTITPTIIRNSLCNQFWIGM